MYFIIKVYYYGKSIDLLLNKRYSFSYYNQNWSDIIKHIVFNAFINTKSSKQNVDFKAIRFLYVGFSLSLRMVYACSANIFELRHKIITHKHTHTHTKHRTYIHKIFSYVIYAKQVLPSVFMRLIKRMIREFHKIIFSSLKC